MKGLLLAAALVLTVVVPVRADVRVDIGINLPGPPTLAVIPGAPVYYAPHTHANVFFYGHQYWLFHAGGWHVGPGWNGPWVVVSPVYVPAPILHVPVRYYKAPPGHWRHWRHDAPPRWEAQYGRDWREDSHERSWREREERWHHHRHGKHKDGDTDRRHGKAKGRDRD